MTVQRERDAADWREIQRLMDAVPYVHSEAEATELSARAFVLQLRMESAQTGMPVEELLAVTLQQLDHGTGHGKDTGAYIARLGARIRALLAG